MGKKWKSQESEQAYKLGVTAAKKNKYKGDDAELESKNALLKGEMKQLKQKTDGEMAADAEKEANMTTKLTKALNGWKTKESEQAYKLGVLGGKKKKWKSQKSEQAYKLGTTKSKKKKWKSQESEKAFKLGV